MKDLESIRQRIITAFLFAITLAFTSCDTVPPLGESQSLTEGLAGTTANNLVRQ